MAPAWQIGARVGKHTAKVLHSQRSNRWEMLISPADVLPDELVSQLHTAVFGYHSERKWCWRLVFELMRLRPRTVSLPGIPRPFVGVQAGGRPSPRRIACWLRTSCLDKGHILPGASRLGYAWNAGGRPDRVGRTRQINHFLPCRHACWLRFVFGLFATRPDHTWAGGFECNILTRSTMDPRPLCDTITASRRSWSFPTSCSLGSLSLSDGSGELAPRENFPSSGSIPILLFDADDASDLLGSDPAWLSSRHEPTNDANTWRAGSGAIGCHVAPDSSSAVLGLADLPAARGCSNVQSSTRGGSERNRLSRSHRFVRPAFSSLDSESTSGSADGHGADSLPSHPHCRPRHSPSARSSSLGSGSRDRLPRSLGSETMRRACCGSREASPAAITTTQLIAPAKKHEQYFALETHDPQIGQPLSNSISLYDSVEQPQPPLTSNHDHDVRDRQPHTPTTPSPVCSSAEADLTIEFPPRRRAMDRDLPPPYSPTIEPSSSSPPSAFHIPHHLAWLQSITISLCIDQEGFRAVFPTFKLAEFTNPALPTHTSSAQIQRLLAGSDGGDVGGLSTKQLSELVYQASMDADSAGNLDAGTAEFVPLRRERFVFHHSTLDIPPAIRRLSVNGDESKDYLSKHAYLSVKSSGGPQVYAVCGSEVRRWAGGEDAVGQSEGFSPIKLEWRFEYAVEDKRKADGTKAGDGEKFLTPLRFSCSPGLLHPKQGRKVTVLSVWRKNIQPGLVAGKVDAPAVSSPVAYGHQTHKLAGSSSPPTSPKNNGALRFPAVTKLWGRWTKASPYRFDKGSDGSEEELIQSGGSVNGTRRPRAASVFASRVSQEAERPLRGWDGDSRKRGQSTDARDARPATAGGERSKRMCKTQSLRRETRSEGEDDRVFTRSQNGHLASRSAYRRRPRTAR